MPICSLATIPVAILKAYRRKGGAVVTVERAGRSTHRYRVSLRRYHALCEWLASGEHPWKTSGAWLRSSVTVSLWRIDNPDRWACAAAHALVSQESY